MTALAERVRGVPRPWARTIQAFPVVAAPGFGLALAFPATHAHAKRLLQEDRLVENATIVWLLLAAFQGGLLSGYDNVSNAVPANFTFDVLIATLGERAEMLVGFGAALGLWPCARRYERRWAA